MVHRTFTIRVTTRDLMSSPVPSVPKTRVSRMSVYHLSVDSFFTSWYTVRFTALPFHLTPASSFLSPGPLRPPPLLSSSKDPSLWIPASSRTVHSYLRSLSSPPHFRPSDLSPHGRLYTYTHKDQGPLPSHSLPLPFNHERLSYLGSCLPVRSDVLFPTRSKVRSMLDLPCRDGRLLRT